MIFIMITSRLVALRHHGHHRFVLVKDAPGACLPGHIPEFPGHSRFHQTFPSLAQWLPGGFGLAARGRAGRSLIAELVLVAIALHRGKRRRLINDPVFS